MSKSNRLIVLAILFKESNGFLYSLSGKIEGPTLAMYPQTSEEGTPLLKGDSVSTELSFTLDMQYDSDVPVQFGLWTREELGSSEPSTPLNENTIGEHCLSSPANVLDENSVPKSSSRFQTIVVTPNVTRYVEWNYTIEVADRYYFGLSSCAKHRVIDTSGVLRWGRGAGGKGGALPATMLGIVPFYGCLMGIYFIMSVVWTIRVVNYWEYTLNLHLILYGCILANMVYATLAFGYYLHIDVDTAVTAEQVFGGIYQGFYRVDDPLAVIVATFRFLLMSFSEILLTFLADGLFVTREGLRKRSKAVVIILVGGQLLLLMFQHDMYQVKEWLFSALNVILNGLWALWLGIAIFFTWKSLKAEDEAEALADLQDVSDVGGDSLQLNLRWAVPLKQRVFTMVWRAVLLYPILVALVSILFLFLSESFTWMWLRLVVVDVWMLFVLAPAAYHWLPYNTDTRQYGPLAQEIPAAASVMEMASVDKSAMIKALTSLDKFSETFRTNRLQFGGESDDFSGDSPLSTAAASSLSARTGSSGGASDRWSSAETEEDIMGSDEESQMIV